MAKPGTPSSPGAFLRAIFLAAIFTSDSVTAFGSAVPILSVRSVPCCRSWCCGNKFWTTVSRKIRQEGALVPLGLILFMTVLYGHPHGSLSTSLQKSCQHFLLAVLIEIFSSFLFCSYLVVNSSYSGPLTALWYSLLARRYSLHITAISLFHQ